MSAPATRRAAPFVRPGLPARLDRGLIGQGGFLPALLVAVVVVWRRSIRNSTGG